MTTGFILLIRTKNAIILPPTMLLTQVIDILVKGHEGSTSKWASSEDPIDLPFNVLALVCRPPSIDLCTKGNSQIEHLHQLAGHFSAILGSKILLNYCACNSSSLSIISSRNIGNYIGVIID